MAHVEKRFAKDKKLFSLLKIAKKSDAGMWELSKLCTMNPGTWRNKIKNKCVVQKAQRALNCFN